MHLVAQRPGHNIGYPAMGGASIRRTLLRRENTQRPRRQSIYAYSEVTNSADGV